MSDKKISLPGRYAGFSEAVYPKTVKKSLYIESFDKTKLAVDVVFPADEEGKVPEKPLPVVLVGSRGGRFNEKGPHRNGTKHLDYMIPYGYIGMVVETRGCGASYGTCDSFGSLEDRKDVKAAIDWAAAQPWCDGNVGMCGMSNRSYIQLAAACETPEALKAITPDVAIRDFYYQNYPNGVSAVPNMMKLSGPKEERVLSREEALSDVEFVDDDPEGNQAYEAYVTGQAGRNKPFVGYLLLNNMCRDSENPNFGDMKTNEVLPPWTSQTPESFKTSGIKQHQIAGQCESGCHGQLMSYKAYGGSIILAPFNHFQGLTGESYYPDGALDLDAEHLRWMDYALKGIDNGMENEPPVAYYTFNSMAGRGPAARPGNNWRYADCWPIDTVRPAKLYFTPDKSGTVSSVNDGSLSLEKPENAAGCDYKIDTSISVFDNEDGRGATYLRMDMRWDGDMAREVDRKGLTFTSLPFFPIYDNELTGHVGVDLWVSSDAPDADFIVYMEEVLPDGTSHFIKDGCCRASHRTVGKNEAWESVGAAYHPSREADVKEKLAEGMKTPVHLTFAIEPVSWSFRPGSRLRFTVTCADTRTYNHNYDPEKPPVITLYTGGEYASSVTVPFVEHTENVYNGTVSCGDYEGPGTLYTFEKNWYLYFNGCWKKYAAEGLSWTMEEGRAKFADFTFRQEGEPILDGVIQDYKGGGIPQSFPAFKETVAVVPVRVDEEMLYVPTVKTLRMNVYRPVKEALEHNPTLVHIHGYGGSISEQRGIVPQLLNNGYNVIGIDIRNYPCNLFPDYVHDLKGNIRYIRANADRFGVCTFRIGCMGQSLGGNSALNLAVTGDDPALEGNVGGNTEFSSRVRAAICGFAWSDLLNMGKDAIEEYEGFPELQAQKSARAEGPGSPLSALINFKGKDRGICVLRKYVEDGKYGTDAEMDAFVDKARYASPVTHTGPDCPPVALFGGYGMTQVDIPYGMTRRSFDAFNRYDVTAFDFSNTQGWYGSRPEVQAALFAFLENYLKKPSEKKLAVTADECGCVRSYMSDRLPAPAAAKEDDVWIPADYAEDFFTEILPGNTENGCVLEGKPADRDAVSSAFANLEKETINSISYVSLKAAARLFGFRYRYWPDKRKAAVRKEEILM